MRGRQMLGNEMVEQVKCTTHGSGIATFICEHLFENPTQVWCCREVTEENPWPDAWCKKCDEFFLVEGEWNEGNESKIKVKLLCSGCYEGISPDYK